MTVLFNLSSEYFNRKRKPLGMCFFAAEDGDDDQQGGGSGDGGGDATPPTSWKDVIPDEYRNHPSLTDITDVGGLVKSYVNAQSMIGMDKIPLPKDEKDPLWNEVFKKLGRPDTPEGYELAKPEEYPEGLDFDENLAKRIAAKAHEAGLSKTQIQTLFGEYTDYFKDKVQEISQFREQNFQQGMESLKKDWGSAYQQNINVALRAVKQYGDDDLVNYLESTGAGNDPRFIKLFHKIGSTMLEDTSDGSNGGGGLIPTPEQAKSKITDLKGDKEFMAAYMSKDHINHKNAVVQMQHYFKLAYPES